MRLRSVTAILSITAVLSADVFAEDANNAKPDETPIAKLVESLADKRAPDRCRCAEALSKAGGEQALTALISVLDDDDPAVRIAAGRSLGYMRDRRAIPSLKKHLGNSGIIKLFRSMIH